MTTSAIQTVGALVAGETSSLSSATEPPANRPREHLGWRAGRPVEDPHKIKRWGFVTAKPSEYLVHVRRGQVTHRSGQGATCFKWPWDSVAVIPTSLQRIAFCADQVTAEKVGVEVVGLAVYRIADPRLAFRVLNFSFPERAQEKLEQTLTAMFVGATRRLVANLTVEECLQKRKSALAEELLREIAPVVGGIGRADDATDRGWGVVIDTIEVQEVRVLSSSVFAAMQTPYRATLEQRAREARALADKATAERQAQCDREIEEVRIEAERAVAQRRAAAEREAAEVEAATALRRAELGTERQQAELEASRRIRQAELDAEAALGRRAAEIERQQAEGQTALEVRKSELATEVARVALDTHEVRARWDEARLELERVGAVARAELRRLASEAEAVEGRAKARVAWQWAEADVRRAEADARRKTAEKLPELAAAIGSRIAEVKVAQYGSGEHPFGQLAAGLQAILDLVDGLKR